MGGHLSGAHRAEMTGCWEVSGMRAQITSLGQGRMAETQTGLKAELVEGTHLDKSEGVHRFGAGKKA